MLPSACVAAVAAASLAASLGGAAAGSLSIRTVTAELWNSILLARNAWCSRDSTARWASELSVGRVMYLARIVMPLPETSDKPCDFGAVRNSGARAPPTQSLSLIHI